jgi:outer membrane lipoprotein carrier protein
MRRLHLGHLAIVATIAMFSTAAWADGIAQMRHFLSHVSSARGSFEQRVVASAGAGPQTSSGSFALQRPGRFRWSYEKPYTHLLVSDGKTLWSHDPELRQAVAKPLGKALTGSPAEFLSGGDVDAHFVITPQPSADGLDFIEAVPRREGSGFTRLRMGFAGNLPALMELHDAFGQITRLRFTRFDVNPALSAESFRFSVPKGTDLIQE